MDAKLARMLDAKTAPTYAQVEEIVDAFADNLKTLNDYIIRLNKIILTSNDRHIVAIGGGGFGRNPHSRVIERYILDLCKKDTPNILFIPTASAEEDSYIVNFYSAFNSTSDFFSNNRAHAPPHESEVEYAEFNGHPF